LRPRKFGEPRFDRGERAHEAARLQELAAPAAAFRQIAVEGFLIDLVHMEEAIRGALVERGVLDVFPDDAGTLLIAATEEIATVMMVMMWTCMLVTIVVATVVLRVELCHDEPHKMRELARRFLLAANARVNAASIDC
jgi:hypothetical protein